MFKKIFLTLAAGVAVFFGTTLQAEVEFTTMSWANNPDDFVTMQNDVAIGHVLNFLNFPETKIVEAHGIGMGSYVAMTDSLVGQLGAEGRVGVQGTPARFVVYLGKPRNIKEIILYTGNIDSRANQDYEVRFVNNTEHPGMKPDFNAQGVFTLTSGDKVIGTNGGGFKSSFRETEDGKETVKDKAKDVFGKKE